MKSRDILTNLKRKDIHTEEKKEGYRGFHSPQREWDRGTSELWGENRSSAPEKKTPSAYGGIYLVPFPAVI